MKYMTPQRLARFRSKDDAVADRAAAAWDKACKAYNEHLADIRSALPKAARSLLRHFSLHDAKVLMLGVQADQLAISILLQLDVPPDAGVQLHYELTSRPVFTRHSVIAEDAAPLVWLYDEFETDAVNGFPKFRHSILFANGLELRLEFRELKLARYKKIFAPRRTPLAEEGAREELESLLA